MRQLAAVSTIGPLAALVFSSITPTTVSAANSDSVSENTVSDSVISYDHPMGSQVARVEGDQSASDSGTGTVGPQAPEPRKTTRSRTPDGVAGIDVSGWQKNVDWDHWWDRGKRFAYVKASEGTGYENPYFDQQYNGSYDVGMIRGAYHFALPDRSSGRAQAYYFVEAGGDWSDDGRTLPGALDMEYNPYGSPCYGKSKAAMAAWIHDFHDTYYELTERHPVIYTSERWWRMCVGTEHDFSDTVPLWIARYAPSVGPKPYDWDYHTFWQYSSDPIDQNVFNGTLSQLKRLAKG